MQTHAWLPTLHSRRRACQCQCMEQAASVKLRWATRDILGHPAILSCSGDIRGHLDIHNLHGRVGSTVASTSG